MRRPHAPRATTPRVRRPARSVPQFDRLEARELLATALGQALKDAVPIAVQPLQVESVANIFGAGNDQHTWKVQLKQGDFVGLSLDTPDGQSSQITVMDKAGKVLATTKAATDPSTLVEAKSGGTYYIKVADKSPQAEAETDTLKVQQFAINKGTMPSVDPATTDERWSWVSGNTLYIAESNGTGYGIKADWKKTVAVDPLTGQKEATYSTKGTMKVDVQVPVMIQSAQGKVATTDKLKTISMAIEGSMTVATNPGTWGASVGTVQTTNVGDLKGPKASKPGSDIVSARAVGGSGGGVTIDTQALFRSFKAMYGIDLSKTSPIQFGIAAGSQLDFLGLPLLDNQTYYYAQVNTGPSASFGGISVGASKASTFTLVVNLADPSVYVTAGPLAFGGSIQGLIPYEADASSYSGPTFNGHLYGRVADVQLGELPVSLDGSAVISLDPLHTGHLLGLDGDASKLLTTSGIKTAFSNIAVGVNGGASLGYEAGGVGVSVPVAAASVGYSPLNQIQTLRIRTDLPATIQAAINLTRLTGFDLYPSVVFPGDDRYGTLKASGLYNIVPITVPTYYSVGAAGSSVNPLKGTPLESVFANNGYAVGASSTGSSASDLLNNLVVTARLSTGGINLGGYTFGQTQGVNLRASRHNLSFGASLGVFVGQANLTGNVDLRNGGFYLTGTLDQSDFPVSEFLNTTSGNLLLTYRYPGYNNGLVANLNIGFDRHKDVPVLGRFGMSGNVGGAVTIDTTNSVYGGDVYANGSLTAFSQPIGGSIQARLRGHTITVSTPVPGIDGFSFDI